MKMLADVVSELLAIMQVKGNVPVFIEIESFGDDDYIGYPVGRAILHKGEYSEDKEVVLITVAFDEVEPVEEPF